MTASPLLLALGGGDDDGAVVDRSVVGRRVAIVNDAGKLHFGKLDDVYVLSYFAMSNGMQSNMIIPKHKSLAATKCYVTKRSAGPSLLISHMYG